MGVWLRFLFTFVCLSAVHGYDNNNDMEFVTTFLKHKHINLVNYYMCRNKKSK